MRIAIFVSNYCLGTSSAIINTCLSLAERGFHVDVFSFNNLHDDYFNVKIPNISVYIFSIKEKVEPSVLNKANNIIKKIIFETMPDKGLNYLVAQLQKYRMKRDGKITVIPLDIVDKTKEILSREKYTAYIGVEPQGLIWAGFVGGGETVPVIYMSLELYLKNDTRFQSLYYDVLRKYEKEVHQRAVATIIQDEERANLLAEHNDVPLSNFILIPVAMKGESVVRKDTYIYDKLKIPRDRKILLCVGAINEDRLSLETARTASRLPDDWVMVFHGWYDKKLYFKKIQRLCGDKLYLSTELLPFDQLEKVVSSSHVGLSLYSNRSDNEKFVGSASGKMAHYFQCGLPVIANDFESVKNIVDAYKCGICISSPSQIPDALSRIVDNYQQMRKNAFRCYIEKYDISFHFDKILNLLNGLASCEENKLRV